MEEQASRDDVLIGRQINIQLKHREIKSNFLRENKSDIQILHTGKDLTWRNSDPRKGENRITAIFKEKMAGKFPKQIKNIPPQIKEFLEPQYD